MSAITFAHHEEAERRLLVAAHASAAAAFLPGILGIRHHGWWAWMPVFVLVPFGVAYALRAVPALRARTIRIGLVRIVAVAGVVALHALPHGLSGYSFETGLALFVGLMLVRFALMLAFVNVLAASLAFAIDIYKGRRV